MARNSNYRGASHPFADLGENEDTRALCLQFWEEFVEDDHFATVFNEMVVSCVWRSRLSTVKKVRVIAAFTKLNVNV